MALVLNHEVVLILNHFIEPPVSLCAPFWNCLPQKVSRLSGGPAGLTFGVLDAEHLAAAGAFAARAPAAKRSAAATAAQAQKAAAAAEVGQWVQGFGACENLGNGLPAVRGRNRMPLLPRLPCKDILLLAHASSLSRRPITHFQYTVNRVTID